MLLMSFFPNVSPPHLDLHENYGSSGRVVPPPEHRRRGQDQPPSVRDLDSLDPQIHNRDSPEHNVPGSGLEYQPDLISL